MVQTILKSMVVVRVKDGIFVTAQEEKDDEYCCPTGLVLSIKFENPWFLEFKLIFLYCTQPIHSLYDMTRDFSPR